MSQADHVAYLERYYSRVHRLYDATRKYYLLGRDALLAEIVARQPGTVLEIGCGTGRNLRILARKLAATQFGAVEPCVSMRDHALRHHPSMPISPDVVEEADLNGILGRAPDVIFFSYSLSMVQDKAAALDACLDALAPGGALYVLDFGDLEGLGRPGRRLFRRWLHGFHVFPEELEGLWERCDQVVTGPLSYWKRGRWSRPRASEDPEQKGAAARHPVQ